MFIHAFVTNPGNVDISYCRVRVRTRIRVKMRVRFRSSVSGIISNNLSVICKLIRPDITWARN